MWFKLNLLATPKSGCIQKVEEEHARSYIKSKHIPPFTNIMTLQA
jgi:hypothetical protein